MAQLVAIPAVVGSFTAAGAPAATVAGSSDRALALALWPLLVAAFVQALPLQVSLLFVATIASDLGSSVALVGGARGLGGCAALLAGVLAAPLIHRLPRARSIPAGLVALAAASGLASAGSLSALIAAYLLMGAAGAMLLPALQAASADRYPGPTGARAATLLTGTGSLTAVLAGPVTVLPAAWWGWRGDFLAVGAVCVLLAGVTAASLSRRPPPDVARLGYLTAFRRVGGAPGAVALLVGSTVRAGLWMAWLAYLAAFFAERFGASPALLAGVWTLGGSAFFLANQVAGRLANRQPSRAGRGWRTPERLLDAGLLTALVAAPALYFAPSLPLALLLTVAQAAAQGVALAGFVSLFIRRYPAVRGAVMGLNAAGFNLGTFAGVGLAGVGLGVAGYAGLGAVLALLGLLAFGTTAWAVRCPAA